MEAELADPATQVADYYRRFAEVEANGRSAIYEDWASGIAEDHEVASLIAQLPGIRRQANLVFASARHAGAELGSYATFRGWLVEHWAQVREVAMERATQTNEAARCAVLLPILGRLDGPLALIEAGASAGLCLYPDRYSYRYRIGEREVALDPIDGPSSVCIPCSIDEGSLPNRLPEVVWRAGVDLNPLDVGDPGDCAWLETLIWPEHSARRERLRAAAHIAAADPPTLVRGDILDELPRLIAQAPPNAQVVVFHTAVLVYLASERREAFVEMMLAMPHVTWISAEGAAVLPSIAAKVPPPLDPKRFLTAVNGEPLALTDPHGTSYESLATRTA